MHATSSASQYTVAVWDKMCKRLSAFTSNSRRASPPGLRSPLWPQLPHENQPRPSFWPVAAASEAKCAFQMGEQIEFPGDSERLFVLCPSGSPALRNGLFLLLLRHGFSELQDVLKHLEGEAGMNLEKVGVREHAGGGPAHQSGSRGEGSQYRSCAGQERIAPYPEMGCSRPFWTGGESGSSTSCGSHSPRAHMPPPSSLV